MTESHYCPKLYLTLIPRQVVALLARSLLPARKEEESQNQEAMSEMEPYWFAASKEVVAGHLATEHSIVFDIAKKLFPNSAVLIPDRLQVVNIHYQL